MTGKRGRTTRSPSASDRALAASEETPAEALSRLASRSVPLARIVAGNASADGALLAALSHHEIARIQHLQPLGRHPLGAVSRSKRHASPLYCGPIWPSGATCLPCEETQPRPPIMPGVGKRSRQATGGIRPDSRLRACPPIRLPGVAPCLARSGMQEL
jgi:hypothetical protein